MRKAAREAQILICIKNPGEDPKVEPLFDNTLDAFQKAVGGHIEVVTLFSDLVLLCNEDGYLKGLPYNTTICGCRFRGPVLAVGVSGDEFTSLKASHLPFVLEELLPGKEEEEDKLWRL